MTIIILKYYASMYICGMKTIKVIKLISFSIGVLLFSSCSEDRETITVEKSEIVESVYSSVVIEPEDLYKVNSSVSGYIDEIPVKVGDNVITDDVLFVIRDIQSSNNTSNSKLAYDLARKNYTGDLSLLEDLKLELENAKYRHSNDSINYSRNKSLSENSLVTKIELEQSELQFVASKNAKIAITNKLKRTERELKSSLAQAKNNYNSSLSRSGDAVIRNKTNGKVYDLTKEVGEYVTMQEPIAIIGSADKYLIKMLIDEVDITRVKINQVIIVMLEAYENKTFQAIVTHISPKMDERTQTFEIEGEFKVIPAKLYMGLTGEGNIVVDERKDVIVIPLKYVVNGKVETADGEVNVKLGIQSLGHVEILSGLKKGDIIYKPE